MEANVERHDDAAGKGDGIVALEQGAAVEAEDADTVVGGNAVGDQACGDAATAVGELGVRATGFPVDHANFPGVEIQRAKETTQGRERNMHGVDLGISCWPTVVSCGRARDGRRWGRSLSRELRCSLGEGHVGLLAGVGSLRTGGAGGVDVVARLVDRGSAVHNDLGSVGGDSEVCPVAADRLEITKPALYHYYTSKDGIVVGCYSQGIANIPGRLKHAPKWRTASPYKRRGRFHCPQVRNC